MTLELSEMTATLLRQHAGGKGVSVSTLAAKLLETIVQDGLYDAVLDEDQTAKRSSAEGKIRATPVAVVAIEERKDRLNKRPGLAAVSD